MAPESGGHLLYRVTVIAFTCRHPKRQEFALVIDQQMELKTKLPAHGALAPGGVAIKDFMASDALVMTHG